MNPPLSFELERCKKIFNTGILGTNQVLGLSALIEILIRLDYILKSLDKAGKRIIFTDDVKNGDISDLINNMRNAACHSDSDRNKIGTNTLIYNVIKGYSPSAIKIGSTVLGCHYEDDIAINFGEKIIYLERHIHRLLQELPAQIT
ncbi:MAG: hypothetical protein AAB895_00395, partial [Patescibacteria group bacterium]